MRSVVSPSDHDYPVSGDTESITYWLLEMAGLTVHSDTVPKHLEVPKVFG
jgi:hypothetical protein